LGPGRDKQAACNAGAGRQNSYQLVTPARRRPEWQLYNVAGSDIYRTKLNNLATKPVLTPLFGATPEAAKDDKDNT
jgi:hypothetical protein